MADIVINGVTYPAPKWVAFPGSDGQTVVFALPTEAEAVLNATSERPPMTKAVYAADEAIRQQISSPYKTGDEVANLTALNAITNPEVNEAHYVISEERRYAWTGSRWAIVSMSEADYTRHLAEVARALEAHQMDTAESSFPTPALSDWEAGTLSTNSGVPATNAYTIRTKYYYAVSDSTSAAFNGVRLGEGETVSRIWWRYCYDRDKIFLGRSGEAFLTGTRYVKYVYGFTSASGITAASYGVENLAADFAMEYLPTGKHRLRILEVGNSFGQDSMAYLPAVFNRMAPRIAVTYGCLYTASIDIRDHVDMALNETPYTIYNSWGWYSSRWSRTGGSNARTLKQVLASGWDIVLLHTTDTEAYSLNNEVLAGYVGTLIEYIQTHNAYPCRIGWIAGYPPKRNTISTSTEQIPQEDAEPITVTNATRMSRQATWARMEAIGDYLLRHTAVSAVLPMSKAFALALEDEDLAAIGYSQIYSGGLLYSDGVHCNAGIPALLSAYVLACGIADMAGLQRDVVGAGFAPVLDDGTTGSLTDEVCAAIGAVKFVSDPDHPGQQITDDCMTHGWVNGSPYDAETHSWVTDENIRKVQRIARTVYHREDKTSPPDLLKTFCRYPDREAFNTLFSWSRDLSVCSVTGSVDGGSNQISVCVLYNNTGRLPEAIVPGGSYLFKISSTSARVYYELYWTLSDSSTTSWQIIKDDTVVIVPAEAVGLTLRLRAAKNKYYPAINAEVRVAVYEAEAEEIEGQINMDVPLIVSFVDDDTSGAEYVRKYRHCCRLNGVRGTFAAISGALESSETLRDNLLSYEGEGFGVVTHCATQNGSVYDDWHDDGSDQEAVDRCRASLLECLRKLRGWGFAAPDVWVTPYGVHQSWVTAMARQLGFKALLTYGDQVHNGRTGRDRYRIKRIALEPDDSNSARSLAAVKARLDAAAEEGCAWAIVTTHFNEWGALDWSEGSGYARFAEIAQYALDLGFQSMTLQEGLSYYEKVLRANGG